MRWKWLLPIVGLLLAILVAFGFFWPFQPHAAMVRLPGVVEIQEVRLGSKIGGRVGDGGERALHCHGYAE